MIIEFTFNDKEYVDVLEMCLEKGLLNLEVDYMVNKQKSIDINFPSEKYMKVYEKYNKYHSRFIKLLLKVKDSEANKDELEEFRKMLKDIVLNHLEGYNDFEFFSSELEIEFHESITDMSRDGKVLYYFIPCEKYIIL